MKKFFISLFTAALFLLPSLAHGQALKLNQISSTTQSIPYMGVIMGDGSPIHTATASSGPTVRYITATDTAATSTLQKTSITGAISLLGEYFTNFTTYVRSLFTAGTGLSVTAGGQFKLNDTAVSPGSYTNTNLTVDQQGRITAASNGSAGSGSAFPFDVHTGYNSTSTPIGFNGLFSTASSTFSGPFYLSALSQGFLFTGTNGLTSTIASSSIKLSWFTNDAGFLTSHDEFPTHPASGVSATTSQVNVVGLLDTASTTLTSNLFLTSLGQGVAYIGSSGKVNSIASSSLNVGTATALAANGTNCTAGNYPLGVDASGNVETCTAAAVGTVTGVTGTWPILSSGGAAPNITFGWSTTSQPASSNLVVSNGTSGFYGVGTSSASCSGGASCSSFTVVGSVSPTISVFSFPFTMASHWGQTSAGTSTPLWLQGTPFSLFASSTVAFESATSSVLEAKTAAYLSYLTSGQLAYAGTGGKILGVATTSETCTSPITCTAHDVLTGGGAITLGTVTVAKGGTNATSFAPNSIITSDSAGTSLIATTSKLTVTTINATSTSATSTFANAVAITANSQTGTTNWNSNEGTVNINNDSSNYTAFQITSSVASPQSAPLMMINTPSSGFDQPSLYINSASTQAANSGIRIDHKGFPALVFVDTTSDNNDGAGKYQFASHNNLFRFEGRDIANGSFIPDVVIGRQGATSTEACAYGRVGFFTGFGCGSSRFDVIGTSTLANLLSLTSVTGATTGDIFEVLQNGNTGIGSSSPFTKLGVAGTITSNNLNATQTDATSTFSGGIVMGRGIQSTLLTSCDTIDTDSSGNFKCGTDATGGAGGANDFTWSTTYDALNAATTSNLWAKGVLNASSTVTFGAGGSVPSMRWDATNGRLGIGTLSPAEMLHLAVTTGNFATMRFDSGSTQGYFFAYDGTPEVSMGSNSNARLNFKVNNATEAYIPTGQGGFTAQSSTGQHSWLNVTAPTGDPQEATLTTKLDHGSGNTEFVDWTTENYGTDWQHSINSAKAGTGSILPISIRFWNSDLGNIAANGVYAQTWLPNGTIGFGVSTSTAGSSGASTLLYAASSTATNLLNIDATAGTSRLVVKGDGKLGVGTTTLSTVPGRVTIASTTGPQLTFQGSTGDIPWSIRSIGGNIYFATSSATAQATSSQSAFSIDSNGFPTFPTFASGKLLYSGAGGKVLNVATTSETCTAPVTCTAHDVLTGGGAITLATVPVASGGTNATSFAPNSIITSNAAGTALIATSSFITVSGFQATGTSATTAATSSVATDFTVGRYIRVGPATAYSWLPNYVADFTNTATQNGFFSLNIQNKTRGTCASADITTANDESSDVFSGFTDIGITSGAYTAAGCSAVDIPMPAMSYGSSYLFNPNSKQMGFWLGTTSPSAYYTFGMGGYSRSNIFFQMNGNGSASFGTTTGSSTPPVYTLTSASSTKAQLALSAGAGAAQWVFRAEPDGSLDLATTTVAGTATTSTSAAHFGASGAAGLAVGTTTPFKTISFAGTGAWTGLTGSSGAQTSALCLSSTNELIADTGTSCLISDPRAKNITGSFTNALDEISKLNTITYFYKPEINGALQANPNFSREHLGYSAKDLAAIDPKLADVYIEDGANGVFSYKKGEAAAPDVYALASLALEGVKELSKRAALEENWQDILIALLIVGFGYQQWQIKKLKK